CFYVAARCQGATRGLLGLLPVVVALFLRASSPASSAPTI
ncbi:hypothetical protein, partial [Pseudomonas sp. FEN]